ncbi:MAG: ABC transporter ATPase, partial [Rhodocyclales bacterium]|nr:ABC transporter ATPase [Rhodocyclales bacterium]
MMTGNEVIETRPLTPARVRLFQPSIRPVARKGEWLETAWGRCKVTGRLGQRHADMLEAVLFCAERRKNEDAGTIKLLVDPARVRKVLSDKRYSLEQCWTLLE